MIEVKVPDIGDFSEVPIIEVLVSPGDEVQPEDPLVTLESDKATMDVPAPAAGKVSELRVVGKDPDGVKTVVAGAGAAGAACTDIVLAHGIENVIACDPHGALHRGRADLDTEKAALVERTNPHCEQGTGDDDGLRC